MFYFDGSRWEREAKLLAHDGKANGRFGSSLSVSGDTALIGTIWDDDRGEKTGAAYVFRFSRDRWVQEAKLRASDGRKYQRFGSSVSISGDRALIGAAGDRERGISAGAAYVFRFAASRWRQEAKLIAGDGAKGEFFGFGTGLSDQTAVIGACRDDDLGRHSGSAYVYRFDGSSWKEEVKLLADDGEELDMFGRRVALSDDVVLVGALYDDDNGYNSGSAYVFSFDGSSWWLEAKLLPSDGKLKGWFGTSVALSGNIALIGAPMDDQRGSAAGAAYVFRFDGAEWVQEAKLLADDGEGGDAFGSDLALSGDTALIGAYLDDDRGPSSGAAYVFHYNGSSWVQVAKLRPDRSDRPDRIADLTPLPRQQCAVCTRNPAWNCDGDVNGDALVGAEDMELVQTAFGRTDLPSLCNYDLDCNGQINPVDSEIVRSLFGTCEEPRSTCPQAEPPASDGSGSGTARMPRGER